MVLKSSSCDYVAVRFPLTWTRPKPTRPERTITTPASSTTCTHTTPPPCPRTVCRPRCFLSRCRGCWWGWVWRGRSSWGACCWGSWSSSESGWWRGWWAPGGSAEESHTRPRSGTPRNPAARWSSRPSPGLWSWRAAASCCTWTWTSCRVSSRVEFWTILSSLTWRLSCRDLCLLLSCPDLATACLSVSRWRASVSSWTWWRPLRWLSSAVAVRAGADPGAAGPAPSLGCPAWPWAPGRTARLGPGDGAGLWKSPTRPAPPTVAGGNPAGPASWSPADAGRGRRGAGIRRGRSRISWNSQTLWCISSAPLPAPPLFRRGLRRRTDTAVSSEGRVGGHLWKVLEQQGQMDSHGDDVHTTKMWNLTIVCTGLIWTNHVCPDRPACTDTHATYCGKHRTLVRVKTQVMSSWAHSGNWTTARKKFNHGSKSYARKKKSNPIYSKKCTSRIMFKWPPIVEELATVRLHQPNVWTLPQS